MLKVTIAAIGKARHGPEATLTSDYLDRFDKTARANGVGPHKLLELEARNSTPSAEAALLLGTISSGAFCVALDERGKNISSPDFAKTLMDVRDDARPEITFVIGGADGLDPAIISRADMKLSFGEMVWPHMLARVMLAEQLYRAATIIAKTPYHRF